MTAFPPTLLPPTSERAEPHHDLSPLHINPPQGPHMSNFDPPFPPPNGNTAPHITHRSSTDFRPHRNGTMAGANGKPVPVPGGRMHNGHGPNARGMPGFDGPRSPPNNKSTSHVPCKFYRQGACQAGKACPFLHSDEPFTETAPCKYFAKGNCKFGAKCALAHVLPDGRVVNRQNIAGGRLNIGGRVNLPHHAEPPPGSSLLSMQAHMAPLPPPTYPHPMQDEYFGAPPNQKTQYDMIPTIDTTFSSHPGSQYGSPPNEGGRLPISPGQKGLSVMDAPLPASFDSNGISHIARYGALAASVPSRFGLGSSPPSSYPDKPAGDSLALRNLHNSAFGEESRNGKNELLASSPPETNDQPFGRRIMHSERFSRSRGPLSMSLGARPPAGTGDDWDDDELRFGEEELVPNSLHELLTPQERLRRYSRDQGDLEATLSHRNSLSRLGVSPSASETKIGSPLGASPSRFQALWGGRPRQHEGSEAGSLSGTSAFGHVGSPLRNSSLHAGTSPALRAASRPVANDASPFVSSPPRQASMSMISQQLQRTRLTSRASEGSDGSGIGGSNSLHPGVNRVTSTSSIGSTGSRLGMDRAISSSSIGRERIEEEQGLFSMEEDDGLNEAKKDDSISTPSTTSKRLSGAWSNTEKESPSFGAIGGQRTTGGAPGSFGKDPAPWGGLR